MDYIAHAALLQNAGIVKAAQPYQEDLAFFCYRDFSDEKIFSHKTQFCDAKKSRRIKYNNIWHKNHCIVGINPINFLEGVLLFHPKCR